jgi:hypothetical protein
MAGTNVFWYKSGASGEMVGLTDENGDYILAKGTTVPTDTDSGYAAGCMFLHTDGGEGDTFYVNEGSVTSCDFNVSIGKSTTDTLTNKTIDCNGTGNVITNVNAKELDPVGDAATGVPFVVSKTVAALDAAGTNILTSHKKMRILDAWFVATSADSGTIAVHPGQVGSIGDTAVVDTITIEAADKGISRATSINDAVWDVAEDDGLVAVGDTGASIDGTIYVMAMRVD